MNQANLTRFGPETIASAPGEPVHIEAAFNAIEGPAQLVIQTDEVHTVSIRINGQAIVDSSQLASHQESTFDLTLSRNNTIDITVSGQLSLRVTQITQADLRLQRQGYFGLNTSDMARQREFYTMLGFTGEIYPAGPETSTSFARSLGFADDYLIYVSLHSLENPPTMPFVDTVQFRGDSYRDEPPYPNLNHIGMAYATYATTNLDEAYSYLQANGVALVSPPATAPNGERFFFMQDQDGAFLKLIETPDGQYLVKGAGSAPYLVKLANTNMNVTDLQRSREFYRLLGFTESAPGAQSGDGDFARAHGFDGPIAFEGEDVSLGAGTDGATLQLRQWTTPYDDTPPYAPPVNHLGIDRINFYVENLTHAVQTMNDLGFEQLGPIGGMPEIGIVFFFDPDGIKVQLAGPQNA